MWFCGLRAIGRNEPRCLAQGLGIVFFNRPAALAIVIVSSCNSWLGMDDQARSLRSCPNAVCGFRTKRNSMTFTQPSRQEKLVTWHQYA